MSWSTVFMAVWFAMYAVMVLTNLQVVAFTVIHGVVAACAAVALFLGK